MSKKTKMRFQLLAGTYREDGKVFKKGQIVESAKDLKRRWPSKFERIEGTIAAEDEEIKAIIEGEDEEEESVTLAMKHKGGSRWEVFNTETQETIHDGYLTRDQAEQLVDGGIDALADIIEAAPKPAKKKVVKAKKKKKK